MTALGIIVWTRMYKPKLSPKIWLTVNKDFSVVRFPLSLCLSNHLMWIYLSRFLFSHLSIFTCIYLDLPLYTTLLYLLYIFFYKSLLVSLYVSQLSYHAFRYLSMHLATFLCIKLSCHVSTNLYMYLSIYPCISKYTIINW